MVKYCLMIAAALMLWSSNVTAQEKLTGLVCAADLDRVCPRIQPGGERILACVRQHLHDISFECLERVAKFVEVRGDGVDCGADIRKQCANVDRAQLGDCLRSGIASLDDICQDALMRAVSSAD